MDIYNIKLKENIKIGKYFRNTNICFLDIETTGFSRKRNIIYLVGVLYRENNYWYVKQFFANNISKEKELIIKLGNFLKTFDTIVTYNGDNFDINFLNHKFKQYELEYSLNDKCSFDIYRIIRKESLFLNLDSLKLESIEEFVGIKREDTLSGKDCIDSYYLYLNTNNKKYKDLILQHNYEDLIYLPDILKVIDIIKKRKTITISIGEKITEIRIKDMIINKDVLEVKCFFPSSTNEPIIIYEKNYILNIDPDNNSLLVKIELKEGLLSTRETCYYTDISHTPYGNSIEDMSQFNLPKHIIPVKIDNKFQIENIKSIIKCVVKSYFHSQFL